MSAPKDILRLVDQFEQNLDSYKSGKYNEAQLRSEFLDPFFKALGWDLDNTQGLAEAYKDVVHEDAIRIGGAVKAPDYCFRIGGTRKFFLEAKKPSVDIGGETSAAYQLRRYAWSAKLPLSILSDFEEFAVYDCRIKPNKPDSAATARVFLCRFQDYPEKWDWIASIFSKDAILKGSFDKYAETNKAKRGTAEVDDDILATIERWRSELARVLALRNAGLSQRELNFAVQRIIDRIIFLRISEDRGIETYGRLLALTNGPNIYPRLCEIFADADAKFNSGLFYFKTEKDRHEPPDELTLGLDVDDKLLRELLKGLYYPESPYEFTVISSDILGQVYEQFLGKVIRLTAGHHAVVEDKPEVKKAGGVYYTPTYIVDYIVRQTVGKLVEGKTPKQAAKIRVLDPACGSGSFLINAYQYLLDWHRDWYVAHKPEGWAKGRNPVLVQTTGGWKLTIAERKRILLDNIYGVDIDPQAVEVTKLSLLLKVLEGESEQTIQPFLRFFQQRALPDLGDNIKCGNSLIGPDFYEQKELPLLSDDDRLRINVFDWDAEFPEIMKSGGFDAVIGNPPYGYMISGREQKYYFEKYKNQDYQKDLYLLFLERYRLLIKLNGLLGIIVPNTWLQSVTYKNIRRYLTNEFQWLKILHLPEKVFEAIVDTHVLVFQRKHAFIPKNERVQIDIMDKNKIRLLHQLKLRDIPRNGEIINIISSSKAQHLYRKILESSRPLSDFCEVYNGIKPFEKGKGIPPQTIDTLKEKPFVKDGYKPGAKWSPLLRGRLINRYKLLWNHDYWILYGEWLAAPRNESIFRVPEKIMVRQTGDSIIATIIEGTYYARNNLHVLLPKHESFDLKYLLGFMNSQLIDYCYTIMNPEKGEALAEVKKQHIEQLPIYPFNLSKPSEKALHSKIIILVSAMLELNRKLTFAKIGQEKIIIQRQIDATDKQIDQLVYQLYGLTDEEIKIVEEAK